MSTSNEREDIQMSKKKKRKQKSSERDLTKILLATAIVEFLIKVIDLIKEILH